MKHGFFDFNFDSDDDEAIMAALAWEEARRLVGGNTMGMTNFYLNYSTPVTVVNTTTETSLLGAPDAGSTKTITPSIARVGLTFWLHFSGLMSATGAATLALRLKLGTTLLQTYPPVLPAIPSTAWVFDVFAVVRAIGAGGTVAIEAGAFAYALNADAATQWSGRATTSPPVAVDLSVNQDWAWTAQWSAASAGDLFRYEFGCVNIVR